MNIGKKSAWLAMLGRNRILFTWIFAIWLILSSQQFPGFVGITICFLGASLRFWSSGYLYKSKYLAIGGPYAFARNPLYLGTYIIALGAVISVKNWLLLIVMTIAFIVIHYAVIRHEEKFLKQLFGSSYIIYCQLVPRFFPRVWPVTKTVLNQVNPDIQYTHFSWQLAWQNKAYETYIAFVALVGLLIGSAYL